MTISEGDSLLSFVVLKHTQGPEDAATDALRFILSRSESAMSAMAKLLGDAGEPLPIAKATTQESLEISGASPDMWLRDSNDNVTAFVESKFWAPLTPNQPVTYWEALPTDRRTTLLFLAPQSRVNDGYLWDELVSRLREKGHELGAADQSESLVVASESNGKRCLMLTSWENLLELMAEKAERDGDVKAAFEIAELKMLATRAAEGVSDDKNETIKQVTGDIVHRLVHAGWANSDGLSWGAGYGYFCRYLLLSGAWAWLGRIDKALEQMPEAPLWLCFYYDSDDRAPVSAAEVRTRLGDKVYSGTELQSWAEVMVPITLRPGVDLRSVRDTIVDELVRIAKIIDPKGPTYRKPPDVVVE